MQKIGVSRVYITELTQRLGSFSRWMRLRDIWQLAQRTFWLAVLAALLAQIAGRLWPIPDRAVWTIAPQGAWLLVMLGWLVFEPRPLLKTACRVAVDLSLRERLSSALALHEQPAGSSPAEHDLARNFPQNLVLAQQQDALHTARQINPARSFPFTWQPRPLALAGILLVAVLASAWLPNRMDAVLAERAAVAQAAQEQAEKIDRLREEVEAAKELSPEEQEELLRQLSELAEALRNNPGDLEQALADISKLEEALQRQIDPNATARQANLDAMASQMQSLAGQPVDPNQTSASQLDQAAEALAGLAGQLGEMSQEERQALAEALAQMAAQAAQSGNSELGQALSSMSQAAQSNDAQAASQAAQQAAQAMSSTQQQLNAQAAAQQAASQLQDSRQALAQAAAAAQAGQNPGQNPGQGQQPGQGQGQNPGQGQGQTSGGGGGSQANTLPPNTGQGQPGRPQGAGQSAAPGADIDTQVFVPWQRGASNGDELFVPGQDTGQGETQVKEGQNPLPGINNPALIPYDQVYYTYLNAANQALQQSYIPAGLQEYVRLYFSLLEP